MNQGMTTEKKVGWEGEREKKGVIDKLESPQQQAMASDCCYLGESDAEVQRCVCCWGKVGEEERKKWYGERTKVWMCSVAVGSVRTAGGG